MEKGLFSPGINFLNRLKYPTKVGLISVIIILLTSFLLYLISRQIDTHINSTKKEIIGLEYVDSLKNLLEDIQQHRALTIEYFSGDKAKKNEIVAKNKEIDGDIEIINKVQEENHYLIKMDKIWREINNNWKTLKANSLILPPEKTIKYNWNLIDKTTYLISYIGTNYIIVLETEVSSFYLARSIILDFPQFTEQTGRARWLGWRIATRKKTPEQEKIELVVYKTLIEDALNQINTNAKVIFSRDKSLHEKLSRFLDDLNLSTNYFLNLTYTEILRTNIIKIPPKDYYNAGTSAIDSGYRLYETEVRNLEYLLKERLDKLEKRKNLLLITATLVLLSVIYIFVCFSMAFLDSVNILENTSKDVANGNLDTEAEIHSNDEMGILANSVNRMIGNLKSLINRELILRKIILSSIESRNINEALRNIVNETGKIFEADRCFFVNYDIKNKEFLLVNPENVYVSSLEFRNIAERKFTVEEMEPFTDIALKQKQVLVVNDVSKIIIPEAARALMMKQKVKSFMMAPMFYAGEPIGLLIVSFVRKLKEFTEDEKKLLESIANQSVITINQALLIEQVQKNIERETLLRQLINNILRSENLENALYMTCEEIQKLFDSERVKIRIYNNEEKVFSEVISECRKNELIPSLLHKDKYTKEVSEYISNILIKERVPIVVDDVEKSSLPEFVKEFDRIISTKSYIIAPIFYKDQLLAGIIIENVTESKKWEKEKLDLLTPICQQIAIGINLFNLNEELKHSLVNEQTLRETIIEVRKLETHDKIYDYLLIQLAKLFNVSRCLHFHFDENENLYVQNEFLKMENLESLLGQTILSKDYTKEFVSGNLREIKVIKDVNNEIQNPLLKEYLINNEIQSYILYPTVKTTQEKKEEVIGLTAVCYPSPKMWSTNEIGFFKLVVDAVSIIYLELQQRQETEEVKRTFVATLTHDLRSPIIAEQKALEYMISRSATCSERNFGEYLEDIYKTNEDLLKIVNNLLSVYHYESGMFLLNKTETNIGEIIEHSVKALKYLADDKESQIYYEVEADLPLISIDRDEIGRVILNLIGNAIKHTRKGTEINVSAKREKHFIQIAIHDNGEGIPKENISMIFQRYPTGKRKIGTGLGLYLSKQIVEAHDGKIWFESKEEKGTTFYFTLPV